MWWAVIGNVYPSCDNFPVVNVSLIGLKIAWGLKLALSICGAISTLETTLLDLSFYICKVVMMLFTCHVHGDIVRIQWSKGCEYHATHSTQSRGTHTADTQFSQLMLKALGIHHRKETQPLISWTWHSTGEERNNKHGTNITISSGDKCYEWQRVMKMLFT